MLEIRTADIGEFSLSVVSSASTQLLTVLTSSILSGKYGTRGAGTREPQDNRGVDESQGN